MSERPLISVDHVAAWAIVGVILAAAGLTLLPFLPAIVWGAILAVDLTPIHIRIVNWVGGRRRLAATLSATFLTLVLIIPTAAITYSVAQYIPAAVLWVRDLLDHGLPPPPAAIRNVPTFGPYFEQGWLALSEKGTGIIAHFSVEIRGGFNWLLLETGVIGTFVFEFAFAILLAGIVLANHDRAASLVRNLIDKTSGANGLEMLDLAVSTTRSVVRGVMGTALVQAAVATFSYVIAGVPGWPLLGALTFAASVIQIGPPLVWIPVAIWLWLQGDYFWALFLIAWGVIVVNMIDNVLRPYLMSKGSNLPMILSFIGGLGGFLEWGIVGVFIGPVVLAVAYDLVLRWMRQPNPNGTNLPSPPADADRHSGA
jgi:predicted PurR-regulated permease PerM